LPEILSTMGNCGFRTNIWWQRAINNTASFFLSRREPPR
jgi:hypothetical protein